jgi:hypothetical protein
MMATFSSRLILLHIFILDQHNLYLSVKLFARSLAQIVIITSGGLESMHVVFSFALVINQLMFTGFYCVQDVLVKLLSGPLS